MTSILVISMLLLLLVRLLVALLGIPHTDLGWWCAHLTTSLNFTCYLRFEDIAVGLRSMNSDLMLSLLEFVRFDDNIDLLLSKDDLRSGNLNMNLGVFTLSLVLLEIDIEYITFNILVLGLNMNSDISLLDMDWALSLVEGTVSALEFITLKSLTDLSVFGCGVLRWNDYALADSITLLLAAVDILAAVRLGEFDIVALLLFLLVGRHARVVVYRGPTKTTEKNVSVRLHLETRLKQHTKVIGVIQWRHTVVSDVNVSARVLVG